MWDNCKYKNGFIEQKFNGFINAALLVLKDIIFLNLAEIKKGRQRKKRELKTGEKRKIMERERKKKYREREIKGKRERGDRKEMKVRGKEREEMKVREREKEMRK